MQSTPQYHPGCLLAHGLVNKLSVIVGLCDLLEEKASEDSECLKRLNVIRNIAKSMAEELNVHQCHLDELTRAEITKKASVPAKLALNMERHA